MSLPASFCTKSKVTLSTMASWAPDLRSHSTLSTPSATLRLKSVFLVFPCTKVPAYISLKWIRSTVRVSQADLSPRQKLELRQQPLEVKRS